MIRDYKLQIVCRKIAEGIDELREMGFTKQQVLEGILRQVDASYGEAREG